MALLDSNESTATAMVLNYMLLVKVHGIGKMGYSTWPLIACYYYVGGNTERCVAYR